MTRLNPPAPNPQTIPYVWSYDKIKPYLLKAGQLITEKQAERRVLMLGNPARASAAQGNSPCAQTHRLRVQVHHRRHWWLHCSSRQEGAYEASRCHCHTHLELA
ncbi:hypothetical protein LB505_006063 [Fusarium chuoi]|nr:hypothetical protein LB505_006063 [Fusarium chuoi]